MLSVKDSMSKKLENGISDADLFKRATLDNAAAERTGYSDYSYWGSTLRVFRKNRVAMLMLILLKWAKMLLLKSFYLKMLLLLAVAVLKPVKTD